METQPMLGPEILSRWLSDSWQLGIGAFFAYLIVNQFWKVVQKHVQQSVLKGAVTLVMLVSCGVWALSFLNVTYMERISLEIVFAEYRTPPVNFLHVALAIVFGILFAVLVSNGWRLAAVLPVALGLAAADFWGNSQLIDGIEAMRQAAAASTNPFGPPQEAWYDYYHQPHLERIVAYAALLGAASALFAVSLLLWRRDVARAPAEVRTAIKADPDGDAAYGVVSVGYLTLRYLSALCFCIALIGNLVVVWSWRLERECTLAPYEMSIFYGDDRSCAGTRSSQG